MAQKKYYLSRLYYRRMRRFTGTRFHTFSFWAERVSLPLTLILRVHSRQVKPSRESSRSQENGGPPQENGGPPHASDPTILYEKKKSRLR